MKSSSIDVAKIAALARLRLTPEEEKKLAPQFAALLSHFEQIQKLDTEGVPPTVYPTPLTNVLRPDEAVSSKQAADLLANAPDHLEDFFKVPKVIE